jgi:beta-lactamase class A
MIAANRWSATTLAVIATACVSAPPARHPRPENRALAQLQPSALARPQTRPPVAMPVASPPPALAQAVRSLWANYQGRAGIAVASSNSTWLIEQRGEELMPQQSVSKLWVAITVMDAIDQGRLRLDDVVTLHKSDIAVFHSPIVAKIGAAGFRTTIADLLTRAMTQSDNTANDFLLRQVGGPQAVRAVISAKGLGAIRFGPGERLLQAKTAGLAWRPEYSVGRAFQTARAQLSDETRRRAMDAYIADPPDGAAPSAIARALLRLKRGELLSARSTRYLVGLMEASETGKARLRGGVPPGWTFAHKTGTGQDYGGRTAGYNDIGLMTAPDGTTYAVVVMIAETTRPIPARQQLMQNVSSTVAAYHGQEAFAGVQ